MPYVVRLSPYLNFVLPVNKGLMLKSQLGCVPFSRLLALLLLMRDCCMKCDPCSTASICRQLEGLRHRGRSMQEHINECMTVRNKLLAINEPVPDRQFTHKLLNVDKELYHVRPTLAHANIDPIVSGLRTPMRSCI